MAKESPRDVASLSSALLQRLLEPSRISPTLCGPPQFRGIAMKEELDGRYITVREDREDGEPPHRGHPAPRFEPPHRAAGRSNAQFDNNGAPGCQVWCKLASYGA
eukprot:scaffold40659_cov38-Prasinocladus_malaysianus.AAC.2